jgi:hypothetical protein
VRIADHDKKRGFISCQGATPKPNDLGLSSRFAMNDRANRRTVDSCYRAQMNQWRQWLNTLCNFPMLAGLWLCDWIAGPMPETEADRIRERAEAAKVVPLARRDLG